MTSPCATMAAGPTFDAISTTLAHWLRLLWNIAPPLRLHSDLPYIAGRVLEWHAPPALPTCGDAAIREAALRMRKSLRALTSHPAAHRRGHEGEVFDPDALVDLRVARRLRNGTAVAVYRVPEQRRTVAAVLLLIDQSASTALANHTDGRSMLETATAAACAMAAVLQIDGVPCAIAGFSSHGRQDVRVITVKAFDEIADDQMAARLQSLRPNGSTRLGSALRHATSRLVTRGSAASWLIVLSDGEPHDLDVHDPRYLVEDARHAVLAAARAGVRVRCMVLAPERAAHAAKIFGNQKVRKVDNLSDVPQALSRLIA